MTFDFLTWIIGYSLSKISDKLIDNNNKLADDLNKVVTDWTNDLPKELYLHPSSIFPNNLNKVLNKENKSLINLRNELLSKKLPTKEQWLNALVEQWKIIKGSYGENAQPFFQITHDEAKRHLSYLATETYSVCLENPIIFRHKVEKDLDKILRNLENLKNQNGISEKFLKKIKFRFELFNKFNRYIIELKAFGDSELFLTANKQNYEKIKRSIDKIKQIIEFASKDMLSLSDTEESRKIINESKKIFSESLNHYMVSLDAFYNSDYVSLINTLKNTSHNLSMETNFKKWLIVLASFKEGLKYQIENDIDFVDKK
jgi:hypothetical protein